MLDLFSSIESVFQAVERSTHCLLCLDYDGTLTPIVDRPERAVLSKGVKDTIDALNRSPFFTVAIVSGRSLLDIRRCIQLPGLFYIGNHGLEIHSPEGERVSLAPPKSEKALENVRQEIGDEIKFLSGVVLEDKGAILAFHYRLAGLSTQAALRRILLREEKRHFETLELTFGKMVMELRPRCPVNKGTALKYLMEKAAMGAFPVYIGDDITDADAFRFLKGKGLSIQVGQSKLPTQADYLVRDPSGVSVFLRRLLEHSIEKRRLTE